MCKINFWLSYKCPDDENRTSQLLVHHTLIVPSQDALTNLTGDFGENAILETGCEWPLSRIPPCLPVLAPHKQMTPSLPPLAIIVSSGDIATAFT
jgi:hypothetical protein